MFFFVVENKILNYVKINLIWLDRLEGFKINLDDW